MILAIKIKIRNEKNGAIITNVLGNVVSDGTDLTFMNAIENMI